MKNDLLFGFLILTTLAGSGCSDSATDPEDTEPVDATQVLSDLASGIMTPTYQDLDDRAGELVQAVSVLKNSPDEPNLVAAQEAWKAARKPWEQAEGFLFGPVDTKGIDPAIDSWPLNKQDLESVLAQTEPLTKDRIDGLENTLKGFHTIEYLLFGDNADKKASGFTPRELDYLIAAAQSLKGETEKLVSSWHPSGENFQNHLLKAGSPESIYSSQKSALQEITNGIIVIADEVANGKINDPLSQSDILLEESRFSDNSKTDFQDNIRSIRNLYLGQYNTFSGEGLSRIVSAQNPALDSRIRAEIADAIEAIGAIPGTFSEAIFSNRPAIESAQIKVRKIQQTFEEDVMQLIVK